MPVGANIRIPAATTGEPAIAAPGDVSSIEEMFGAIIAHLGDAAAPQPTIEAASPEQPLPSPEQLAAPDAPAATTAEVGITQVVEQLIALASGDVGAADRDTMPSSDPTPVFVSDDKPAAVPAEVAAPAPAEAQVSAALEQLLAVVGRVAIPSARPDRLAAAEPKTDPDTDEILTPDAPPFTEGAAILPFVAPVQEPKLVSASISLPANTPEAQIPADTRIVSNSPAAAVPPEAQEVAVQTSEPEVAPALKGEAAPPTPVQLTRRTETAVQQAFSTLQAVVKELPAQIWAAALPPSPNGGGDRDQVAPIQDLKLTPLGSLPSIGTPLAPLEGVRSPQAPQPLTAAAARMDNAEMTVERQLDMAHEGEWLDQLARDIAQTAGSDKNPLRFRLNPETLGTLRVEISQERHGTAIRFTADTEAARTIIADAQPRLIAEARAQGIRISEAHVDLGSQTASGDPRRQNMVFEEAPLRTARSLQDQVEGDGNPTPGRSERYA